jgi:hypothetical protein
MPHEHFTREGRPASFSLVNTLSAKEYSFHMLSSHLSALWMSVYGLSTLLGLNMKHETMYTVIFGTLAAIIAIATMIQNSLQNPRGMPVLL